LIQPINLRASLLHQDQNMSTEDENTHRASVYAQLVSHIQTFFQGHRITERSVPATRVYERLPRFRILEIAPGPKRALWTYITIGAWGMIDDELTSMEFMLFAPEQHDEHLTLLAMIAYYHARDGGVLGLGHTVPIGYPWLPGSACDHLLISHSYPSGWNFEHYRTEDFTIHIWWALPITEAERDFKQNHGLEALEVKFEEAGIHYWEADRPSVV
jgi:suppressor of fused protein SUFU